MSINDRSSDELLTSLKVISRVRQHERLSTSGSTVRVETYEGIVQSIMRWFNGESRDRNIETISTIIANAFTQLELRSTKENQSAADRVFIVRLRDELHNTLRGLSNLQTTYERDSVAFSRIEVLRDRIQSQLDENDRASIDDEIINMDGYKD